MKAVLIFDADNTLWDTDSVFRNAQFALLNTLAHAGLVASPETQLATLRSIDQELVLQLGQAEYDFKVLVTALAHFYAQSLTIAEAVHTAIATQPQAARQQLASVIDKAYHAFEEGLRQIPPLFRETEPVLDAIRSASIAEKEVATVMLTEGSARRLERIIEAHGIRRLFDEIILAPKSRDACEQALHRGVEHLPKRDGSLVGVMIGDSLHRDVKFANQAGLITVYKPSAYKGVETPRAPDEQPYATIATLAELPTVLNRLDLAIPPLADMHH